MGLADVLRKSLLAPSSTFWPHDLAGSAGQRPGIAVTPASAMGVTAYYAGVRVLAESVASLPLIVYRRLEPRGKERAAAHPLYPILHDRANPEMTSFMWRETAMGHLVSWGNAYSEIQRDGRGRIVALWPLRPDRMEVRRERDPGPIAYRYRLPRGELVTLPAERVFHVRGLGFDGLVGYSPIEIMRRTLALALAAQEYGERTFENDARPGVVLTHPKTLSDTARANLERGWRRNHEGLSNAQRAAVLEEGISVTTIGFPPEQAQFIEARKMQRSEIATGLRLPPHMIGDLEHATFSNIEHQGIDFVTHSLRPWLVRIEAQIGMDLIPEPEFFAEFLIDGLLRGDAVTRAQALNTQRLAGVLNGDEWREIENRNPIPDGTGQAFWQPANITTINADGSSTTVTLAPPAGRELLAPVEPGFPAASRNGHAAPVAVS